MPMLRPAVLAFGIVLTLAGLLFAAQGSGIFPYPKSSFVIAESGWIVRGAIIAVVGLGFVLLSRRLPR